MGIPVCAGGRLPVIAPLWAWPLSTVSFISMFPVIQPSFGGQYVSAAGRSSLVGKPV